MKLIVMRHGLKLNPVIFQIKPVIWTAYLAYANVKAEVSGCTSCSLTNQLTSMLHWSALLREAQQTTPVYLQLNIERKGLMWLSLSQS